MVDIFLLGNFPQETIIHFLIWWVTNLIFFALKTFWVGISIENPFRISFTVVFFHTLSFFFLMIKAQNFYYIHTRNSLQSKINLKTKCYNCLHTQLYQINNFKMQTQWKYAEMCVGREWGLMAGCVFWWRYTYDNNKITTHSCVYSAYHITHTHAHTEWHSVN